MKFYDCRFYWNCEKRASRFTAGIQPDGIVVKMLFHKKTLELNMRTLTAANLLTPGQRRAKEQREQDAFIRAKFQIDNNPNPQYFNGTISRGFKMGDFSVYIEFNQYNNRYQTIIAELSDTYGYAKRILEQFEAGMRKNITVKGICGRVNDKGIRNIKSVSFLK